MARLSPERESEIRRITKSRAMADAAWSFTKADVRGLLREIDALRRELKTAKEDMAMQAEYTADLWERLRVC